MAKILLFGMCLCAFASAHTEAAELSASTESPSTNLLVASPSGQPLNAEEAKQALQRVRLGGQLFHFPGIFPADPKTIPGTWRHLEICDDPDHDSSSTNVTYERRGPNGQLFKREEETSCRTNGNSRTQHRLRLQNEEGLWYVHETIAINCVQPPSVQKVGSPALLESGVWVKLDPSSDFTVRGERFQEAGRGRLRIFQQCSAQTQQRLEKEMKKAIPFLIRPLVSNSFLKQALAQIVPLRLETVMDDESGELMVRRGFASDGRLLYEEGPCSDLPASAYEVPSGVKRVRARSADDAKRLEMQLRSEERAIR